MAIHRRLLRELTNSGRRVPAIGATAKYRGAAVVGVDKSVESFTAVRWAAKRARLRECPLVVVHAGEASWDPTRAAVPTLSTRRVCG